MAEIMSLRDAVAHFVKDGDKVAMEGFTHLIPHAAGHEIIRQGRRDLSLVRMTPDMIYDQMIGMGCATRLTFSWGAAHAGLLGDLGQGHLGMLRPEGPDHREAARQRLDEFPAVVTGCHEMKLPHLCSKPELMFAQRTRI